MAEKPRGFNPETQPLTPEQQEEVVQFSERFFDTYFGKLAKQDNPDPKDIQKNLTTLFAFVDKTLHYLTNAEKAAIKKRIEEKIRDKFKVQAEKPETPKTAETTITTPPEQPPQPEIETVPELGIDEFFASLKQICSKDVDPGQLKKSFWSKLIHKSYHGEFGETDIKFSAPELAPAEQGKPQIYKFKYHIKYGKKTDSIRECTVFFKEGKGGKDLNNLKTIYSPVWYKIPDKKYV